MVAPPRDKFDPPGGSFQYNQSRAAPPTASGVVLASAQQPAAPSTTAGGDTGGKPGSAIRIGGGSPQRMAASLAAASTAGSPAPQPQVDPEVARVVEAVNEQQRAIAGKTAFKEVGRAVVSRPASQVAIVTPDTVSDATESFSARAQ
jgi:hypothetical protein